MGATDFSCTASGRTANDAFRSAVDEARYEEGNGGYTGTIAEKSSFKMISVRPGETPRQAMDRCFDDEDHWCQDKNSPAACVEIGPDPKDKEKKVYVFFGWAST